MVEDLMMSQVARVGMGLPTTGDVPFSRIYLRLPTGVLRK